jgi:cytochrome P450
MDFRIDLPESESRDPLYMLRQHDELRGLGPIFWTPDGPGYYVVTNHDALLEVFQDANVFSNRTPIPTQPDSAALSLIPITLDPPDHNKWRKVLASYFTPQRARRTTGRIRQLTNELIDKFADDGECELVSQFCRPLPGIIFCDLMGLPEDNLEQMLAWAGQILHAGVTEDDPAGGARQQAMGEVLQFLWQLVQERRAHPDPSKQDILSQASEWRVDGRVVTDAEVLQCALALFIGGLDTVAAMISYFFYHLATHGKDRQWIVRDPAIIPNAVEELLRVYPIARVGREVAVDYEIAGCPLKPGDRILLATMAANRDETIHINANQVQLDREEPRHWTFGAGPHRCLGSHLARVELEVVLEEWHRRIPEYRISDVSAVRERPGTITNLTQLPLAW